MNFRIPKLSQSWQTSLSVELLHALHGMTVLILGNQDVVESLGCRRKEDLGHPTTEEPRNKMVKRVDAEDLEGIIITDEVGAYGHNLIGAFPIRQSSEDVGKFCEICDFGLESWCRQY
jgi:hypothetical protein